MSRRSIFAFIALMAMILGAAIPASAQIMEPVKWTVTQSMTSADEGVITFAASIDAGWHMYDMSVDPDLGPTPLTFNWEKLDGVKLIGSPEANKEATREMDDMFEAELSFWTGSVTITQRFKATAEKWAIEGYLRFGACNDMNCIPPTQKAFDFAGTAKLAKAEEAVAPVEEVAEDTPADEADAAEADGEEADGEEAPASTLPDTAGPIGENPLWAPVDSTAQADGDTGSGSSLVYIFLACFVGGLLALLTPCVWPMIPMTVSFFLKKGGNRRKSITDAVTYGISIIVIYVLLGLLVSAIFGASALNALSTNAVVNIIFFLLLVVFAISFFGAFDIKMPESWANKIDSKAEKTTGLVSIFFMAFTLTLVSFSCTGPIIGTLLVEAAGSGSIMGPAVGMLGFSIALALPFCLFAMFPTMLSSMPSSGGWMNTVKVVLGFIELALSLKFLSVADMAYGWRLLDREIFLALWIVIFLLLGLYLLGKFNFSHYGEADSSIGVGRFFLAGASLAFAIYLVPGLWGAPLKGVSAFLPLPATQDFNLYDTGLQEYDNYDEGMKIAAQQGMPALIDFSGYGCVNCRKMEGAVLDQPEVRRKIEDNFVVIKLMVDEKKDLPQPVTVVENGSKVKLKSYGDYWSYLQRHKFSANAQPYYVILNNEGQMLSGPFSYKEDIPGFMEFLDKGIDGYKK